MDNIYNITSGNFKTLDSKLFENEKEFLLFISSGFFADNGDGGIGGTSMTVAQSDSILGTKLTAVSATSAVGTDFTVVIS